MLYVFQEVPPPIIRSSKLCTRLWVYIRVPTHDSGKKQKKLDKYPMLCIKFLAPDDGRKNRLKHVEHL